METKRPTATDSHPTLCVTCNDRDGTAHRMRVHHRDGTHTDMEPSLCDRCLDSHREREWIELRERLETG